MTQGTVQDTAETVVLDPEVEQFYRLEQQED
jgi:hypothetical protein